MEREFLEGLRLGDEAIDRILAELERLESEREASAAREKIERGVDERLKELGARSLKAAGALLNFDEIGLLEDGTLTGLEEQLGTLMAENAFLFEGSKTPRAVAPSSAASGGKFSFGFTGIR